MESIDRGLAVRFTHRTTWRPVEFLRIFFEKSRPAAFFCCFGYYKQTTPIDASGPKTAGISLFVLTLELIAELTFLSKYSEFTVEKFSILLKQQEEENRNISPTPLGPFFTLRCIFKFAPLIGLGEIF